MTCPCCPSGTIVIHLVPGPVGAYQGCDTCAYRGPSVEGIAQIKQQRAEQRAASAKADHDWMTS